MASIGPQLPPHLQKRKRTPEDDSELGSPPPKASRRDNKDEIPLEDYSDDGYGPSAPVSAQSKGKGESASGPEPAIGPSLPPPAANNTASPPVDKKRPIGPSLPPTAVPTNEDEIPLDDSSGDEATGPAFPPSKAGPDPPPPTRVRGPAPPPADLAERPATDVDSDSSDDDNWGPTLPGAPGGASRSTATGPTAGQIVPQEQAQPAAPKRDDWMLAPPTSSGYRAPDPTKLRARKFASGPRAATDGKPAGISSIWTETAEEKARRLANAVLGREDPNAASQQPTGGRPSRQEASGANIGSGSGNTRADQARIKSYVEQTRGRSLVEEHQAARAAGKASAAAAAAPGKNDNAKWGLKGGVDENDDDPSKRAFDWEKDMKVGGRTSNSQRKELLNRAASFGGRFQSGRYL